jgi:hypothetical protein
MADDERPDSEKIHGVEIDYDHLDVAAIMDQVKKIAAAKPPAPGRVETEAPAEEAGPAPACGGETAPPPPAPPGFKQKVKAKAARVLAPFYPLLRLFALPLHEELKAVVRSLDDANRRFDARYDALSVKADARFRDLDRSMEYIKLLHNLDHNLVVEVTKLRVELESLKSRARILEKDLESAGRRERALEARIRP